MQYDAEIYLFCWAIPIALLIIFLAKKQDVWLADFKKLSHNNKIAVLVIFGIAVAWGGSKPGPVGPTKSNLKLLIADRAKLSNGQVYGKKALVVSAAAQASAAAGAVTNALVVAESAATTYTNALAASTAVAESPRYYLRLRAPAAVVTNSTIYAETQSITVADGVAEAAVWFSTVPNSEPEMRFHFAADTATNRWHTATPTGSTFPDTFTKNGKTCYLYYFALPDELLKADGSLLAPLQWSPVIAFGSPETGEAFDLRGGLAIEEDGEYYLAVTGYRTNGVGQVFYFDNGRLANPPTEEE